MRNSIRLHMVSVLAVVCSIASAVSLAQSTSFNLPSQSLADSLRAVAGQTNSNILFNAKEVAGLSAKELKAELTQDEALKELLKGTGLTYQYLDEKTIAVGPVARIGRSSGAGEDWIQLAAGEASASEKEGESTKLEEIVVTAQKRQENLQDVPVPVAVVRAEGLIDNNQLRIQDYYTRIPGLSVITHEGGTWAGMPKVVIRGITTGGFSSTTVGTVIDDVPFVSSGTGSVGFTAPDIDPNDLARVEVLRGPQGTLYGASSMGGLLKYVTIDPSTEEASGSVRVGSSGIAHGDGTGYSVRGAINLPVSDSFAVRGSAFTRQDPGFIDNPETGIEGVNSAQADGGRLSALWRPSEKLSLKVSALYQKIETDGSSFVHVLPGLKDLQQSAVRDTGGFSRKTHAATAVLQAELGRTELTAVTGYIHDDLFNKLDMTPYFVGLLEDNFGVSGSYFDEGGDATKFSQEIRLTTPIGDRLQWLFGALYSEEDGDYGADFYPAERLSGRPVTWGGGAHGKSEFTELSAFTNLTAMLSDRLDVQVGVRGSEMEGTSGPSTRSGFLYGNVVTEVPSISSKHNAVTHLVTPRFKVSQDLMVYARFASGYRPGGGGVSGQGNDLCVVYHTPCTFKPDKTMNYELGVKGNVLDNALSFDASVYYIDWKDIQIERIAQEGPGFAYSTNAGQAKSQGLELSLEARPLDDTRIGVSATWGNAQLTEDFPIGSTYGVAGDKLPYSSRFSGNLMLEQEIDLSERVTATVGGSVSYVGERTGVFTATSARQTYPAYAQTNLHAGAQLDSWSVDFFVNNLTDKRVVVSGGVGSLIPFAYTLLQPRTVGLSITKTFGSLNE